MIHIVYDMIVRVMVFNGILTIFQLYCGGGNRPGETHRSVASHYQIVSHNVVSSTPRLVGIRIVFNVVLVVFYRFCDNNYPFYDN
jgi:hypothetical protein